MPGKSSAKKSIKLDVTYYPYFKEYARNKSLQGRLIKYHEDLKVGRGDVRDKDTAMTGWKTFPLDLGAKDLRTIKAAAMTLRKKIDVFLSLGIGGSYLGTEALLSALNPKYFNNLTRSQRKGAPEIYFLGQNMDSDYFDETLRMIRSKKIGINVISKSGTTTETAIAFRILKKVLRKRYGKKAGDFIIATTDRMKGALREFAEKEGCATFDLPDDIGGRFSVTSVVGLLAAAMTGVDIEAFIGGARTMERRIRSLSRKPLANPAYVRAAMRYLAHKRHGKDIEVVATNCEKLKGITSWMEQLYPESEGKNGEGLWVSPSMYSEKAHANGQMVQSGKRNLIETFVRLAKPKNKVMIPYDPDDSDGLNYLAGKQMNFINDKVIDGLEYAHAKGHVPSMTIHIPELSAKMLGEFIQLEMNACALSGLLLKQNPFIQPGVQDYKDAMFALSGKKGFEAKAKKMKKSMPKTRMIIG